MPTTGNKTDHTFIWSSHGDKWGCHGRGGPKEEVKEKREICRAQVTPRGLKVARCLSQTLFIYGTTGVCHQLANRVLYPAGVTVSRARGYAASVAMFGPYGIDPLWSDSKRYCTIKSILPDSPYAPDEPLSPTFPDWPTLPLPKPPKPHWPPWKSRDDGLTSADVSEDSEHLLFSATQWAEQESPPDERASIGDAFDLVIEHRLQRRLTATETVAIKTAQGIMKSEHHVALTSLQDNLIGFEQYAGRINVIMTRFLSDCELALNKSDYLAVFDDDPDMMPIIADIPASR